MTDYKGWPTENDYPRIFEAVSLFPVLYDKIADTKKYSKEALEGDFADAFLNAMISKTGLISNLLQKSFTNDTWGVIVDIPNMNVRTGIYDGTTREEYIVNFLSEELQIAVDRLKNNLQHNDEGIKVCQQEINNNQPALWLRTKSYKNKKTYIENSIAIGENDTDTMSDIMRSVNEIWETTPLFDTAIQAKTVRDYVSFFPNRDQNRGLYNQEMLDWARLKTREYGMKMSQYLNLPEDTEEQKNKKNGLIKSLRLKALSIVEIIEKRDKEVTEIIDQIKKKYNGKIPNTLPNWYTQQLQKYQKLPQAIIPFNQGELPAMTSTIIKTRKRNGETLRRRETIVERHTQQGLYGWAACFWEASHYPEAGDKSKASLMFLLFPDMIIQQLQNPMTSVAKIFGLEKKFFGAIIWGKTPPNYSPLDAPQEYLIKENTLQKYALYIDKAYQNAGIQLNFNSNLVLMKIDAPDIISIKLDTSDEWKNFGKLNTKQSGILEVGNLYAARLYTQGFDLFDNTNGTKSWRSKWCFAQYIKITSDEWDNKTIKI